MLGFLAAYVGACLRPATAIAWPLTRLTSGRAQRGWGGGPEQQLLREALHVGHLCRLRLHSLNEGSGSVQAAHQGGHLLRRSVERGAQVRLGDGEIVSDGVQQPRTKNKKSNFSFRSTQHIAGVCRRRSSLMAEPPLQNPYEVLGLGEGSPALTEAEIKKARRGALSRVRARTESSRCAGVPQASAGAAPGQAPGGGKRR